MRIKLLGAALAGALATWLVFAAVGVATTSKPAASSSTLTFHLVEVDPSAAARTVPASASARSPSRAAS